MRPETLTRYIYWELPCQSRLNGTKPGGTGKLVSVRDDATAHVMLGMTLMNDGDIEGASLQIERALQKDRE